MLASTDAGFLLGPETVRRLACDAGVIPVVLGSDGEVLDLGRRVRLFTEGQAKALWLRDGGCTFPGCTAPAAWSDAHHLWHWADGGPSDVDNAALLCGRHHTVVHTKGYFASVVEGQVDWDLTPVPMTSGWPRGAPRRRPRRGRPHRRTPSPDGGHHDDGHHDDGHHDGLRQGVPGPRVRPLGRGGDRRRRARRLLPGDHDLARTPPATGGGRGMHRGGSPRRQAGGQPKVSPCFSMIALVAVMSASTRTER